MATPLQLLSAAFTTAFFLKSSEESRQKTAFYQSLSATDLTKKNDRTDRN